MTERRKAAFAGATLLAVLLLAASGASACGHQCGQIHESNPPGQTCTNYERGGSGINVPEGWYQVCDSELVGTCTGPGGSPLFRCMLCLHVWGTGPCVDGWPSGDIQSTPLCGTGCCGGIHCL